MAVVGLMNRRRPPSATAVGAVFGFTRLNGDRRKPSLFSPALACRWPSLAFCQSVHRSTRIRPKSFRLIGFLRTSDSTQTNSALSVNLNYFIFNSFTVLNLK